MKRTMLKSKIHRATVTGCELDYEGSISIDEALCRKADLMPYERVEIYNVNNGNRFATYVILGESGQIRLNGAAARMCQKNDLVIIASFADIEDELCKNWRPTVVHVDGQNRAKD